MRLADDGGVLAAARDLGIMDDALQLDMVDAVDVLSVSSSMLSGATLTLLLGLNRMFDRLRVNRCRSNLASCLAEDVAGH
jgi:hypothetical protein